jgi:signal transduction histidine kinase
MMEPAGSTEARHGGVPRLWGAFIVIISAFVLGNIVSIYEMRNSQAQIRLITKHAATNIELISQLSRDLNQKRVLVEDHILEKMDGDMDRIEGELAAVDADIAKAMRSYETVGDEETEAAAWKQLAAEIAAIEPQIAKVVSLSRRNLDAEALSQFNSIGARFQTINQASDTLLALNRARANHEVAHVRALQRHAVIFLGVLTILWTAFALLTARWSTRLIMEREHQMRHAMSLLEERNRELDAFAGRVAHDLRGPLTAINLAASSILKRGEGQAADSAVLRRGVDRTEAIIQDLLTLSRISAQVIGATCDTANVTALALEDLRPIVDGVGGVIAVEAAGATVSCNEGLLRQALWNLGENAVKYRRPEVQLHIEIYGRVTPRGYELSVSDNGQGMSSSEARRAFEPFFRGTEAEATTATGLGLSIVKRVIEASGGNVTVDSIAGRGTTFNIRLKLAADELAA